MSAAGSAGFWEFVAIVAGIYTIFGLGLQVQLGFAGLLNFGHVASMALAAYAMAILTVKAGFPLWLASAAGIAASVAFGLLVGLPTLRLRSDYFAITTLAVAEIVRYTAANTPSLTGGTQGTIALAGPAEPTFYNAGWLAFQADVASWLSRVTRIGVSSTAAMVVIVWAIAVVIVLFLQFSLRRPWGRVLRSIREDEDVAAALGKNVFSFKLQALALGSAIGGLAGLLNAFQIGFFGPSDFDPLPTLVAFLIVILGGVGHPWGVPLGAAVYSVLYAVTRFLDFAPLSYLSSAERAYLRLFVVGAVLVALMAFRPQGIFGRREELAFE